jgi:hypothetical protein
VPLTEREQRILEEIEKNLADDDPGFAKQVRRDSPRQNERRLVKTGVLVFLAGFASLIAFFVSSILIVGIVAFGAMVGGIVLIAGAARVLAADKAVAVVDSRDRAARSFKQWQRDIQERYKRR